MGRFAQNDVDELLVQCHRRCCICHRFCGVKIETDHIEPTAEGGTDDITNAIAVCFECHAEIHSYNDQHPRGRKFRADELRKHKEQWLSICRERPEVLAKVSRMADVGPLQALIDELQFNLAIANSPAHLGSPFLDDQFKRAIQEGAIATLEDSLRASVTEAYMASMRAGHMYVARNAQNHSTPSWLLAGDELRTAIQSAAPKIQTALDLLLRFLGTEK